MGFVGQRAFPNNLESRLSSPTMYGFVSHSFYIKYDFHFSIETDKKIHFQPYRIMLCSHLKEKGD
jgi:hypothetical protein